MHSKRGDCFTVFAKTQIYNAEFSVVQLVSIEVSTSATYRRVIRSLSDSVPQTQNENSALIYKHSVAIRTLP
jgi:hypothetical protein